MENFCASYVRQVSRELKLPQRRKRALLDGLRLELEEQFPQGADRKTLLAQVGPPAETAHSLLDGVGSEEQRRYQTVRRRRSSCIIAALALLLAASIVTLIYFDGTRVGRAKIIVTQDSAPVDYSSYPGEAYHAWPFGGK